MKPKSRARVFLVDDHEVVRAGLSSLLSSEPDLEVCGEAATALEALERIPSCAPNLVILDLSLGAGSGLSLLKDLRTRHPGVPVLVLSIHDEQLYAERVLHLGAMGYVMKQEAADTLRSAAREVLAGRIHVSPRMRENLIASVAGRPAGGTVSPVGRLTNREMEVFELIGRGIGTRSIARRLCLSVKTIETHRANIKEKLGLENATQLVAHAVRFFPER